jgi:peptidoglycan/LPS O-acetylase OafA/YrhL
MGKSENKRLDILRCIAVVTVILHHSGESRFFTQAGWIGVDLFFVLSGFLISGLLFSEYKRRQQCPKLVKSDHASAPIQPLPQPGR